MRGGKALEMGANVIVGQGRKSKENIDTPRPKPISYRPISTAPAPPGTSGRRSGITPMSAPQQRPQTLVHSASLPGHRVEFGRETPLVLDSGAELGPFT